MSRRHVAKLEGPKDTNFMKAETWKDMMAEVHAKCIGVNLYEPMIYDINQQDLFIQ